MRICEIVDGCVGVGSCDDSLVVFEMVNKMGAAGAVELGKDIIEQKYRFSAANFFD